MSVLELPPRPRGQTGAALGLLALVAAAAFTQGFVRQLNADRPAPPPREAPDLAVAEATPAPMPLMQTETVAKPRRHPRPAAAAPVLDVPPAAGSPALAASESAADAAAVQADAAAPSRDPDPSEEAPR